MRAGWLLALVACEGDEQRNRSGAGPGPEQAPPEQAPPEEAPPSLPDVPRSVPLLGGTLEPVPALEGLVASLPEEDRLVLSRDGQAPVYTELGEDSVPFRLLVEGERAWVSLRGTGEVARVDLPRGEVLWRTRVCPEPRGVERAEGSVLVACASGELVQVDDEGEIVRNELLEPDLRDVLLEDGALFVSRFRAAEVLILDPTTWELQHRAGFPQGGMAWRMRPAPDLGVAISYQLRMTATLQTREAGYGSGGATCEGPSHGTIGEVRPDGGVTQGPSFPQAPLPVDFLQLADGTLMVLDGSKSFMGLMVFDPPQFTQMCEASERWHANAEGSLPSGLAEFGGRIVIHSTQPDRIDLATQTNHGIDLPPQQVEWLSETTTASEPFRLFHADPGSGISCASCHPEGTDDARVWDFVDLVPRARRTMTLAGGVSARAPFHWLGEHESKDDLMGDTFEVRMGGDRLSNSSIQGLFAWLDGIRPVRATVLDQAAVLRGEIVFGEAGCEGCHAGAQYTNNDVISVRPGESTKVPTLQGIGLSERLMHDGCADSIEERLSGDEGCTGGTLHGDLTGHSREEIADLAAFLRSL